MPISDRERRLLEIALVLICLGIMCLMGLIQGYKLAVLNLFFLPVVLGAFFLGRYQAGSLALLSVIAASLVTVFSLDDITLAASPLVIALAVTTWAAVLGLTALLAGTLSDDRARKVRELHEAYVGVIEVLSRYLHSAHPRLKARAIEVAELSQEVAAAMRLSPRQIDDIRVAALLYDVGNIEITARVIRRAMGSFDEQTAERPRHTFQGMDLMMSLGNVLSGAVPLLLNQSPQSGGGSDSDRSPLAEIPIGARIIGAVRAYLELAQSAPPPAAADGERMVAGDPWGIFDRLRRENPVSLDGEVLAVLERVVARQPRPCPTLIAQLSDV